MALILFLWAASLLFMLIWGFLVSVTEYTGPLGYANNRSVIFPRDFNWGNYVDAFSVIRVETNNNSVTFFGLLFNSLWYSFGSAFLSVMSTVFLAYVVARYKFRYCRIIYAFVLVQMLIPSYGTMSANYELLDSLRLLNSPWYLLTKMGGTGMYFLIVQSYYSNIAATYDEAAMIDGAGHAGRFFRIMLPLGRPVIVAMFLLTFIGTWNDYSTMLVYMEDYPTLASGLYLFADSRDFQGAPTYFAGIFIAAVPISVLFLCFNKILMENLTIGGIKG